MRRCECGERVRMRGGAAWGRERVRTFWVGGCLDDVLEAHVGDVVYVYLVLEDDDEGLAVELDGEDGGGEEELADHGLALRARGRAGISREHEEERGGVLLC